MKAFAIATIHYKVNPGNKEQGVTVALANTIIENLDQGTFDELVKLGAVREATELDEARAKALRPAGADGLRVRVPGASTDIPGTTVNAVGTGDGTVGAAQAMTDAQRAGTARAGVTTTGVSRTGGDSGLV